MPIVFAAITPHPPILIPSIGKENLSRLKATTAALKELEEELYAAQPQTIIIISPHGELQEEAFSLNLSPEFTADFEDFGDFSAKFALKGDVVLAHQIREKLETKAPLQMTSRPKLDHGAAVPLYFLTAHLPKIKIIPLYYSGLSLEAHYNFGQLLKNELQNSVTRVALVASGDLSHRLTKTAPAGFSPKGKKFDAKLIDLLTKKDAADIVKLNPELIADAGECGLKSILILLGMLDGMKYEPELLSYEGPFGIGYLVMNFKL